MRGASDPAIITEWRRLAEAGPNGRVRADFVGLALVFVELVRHKDLWKTRLEGLNMRVSKQVLEWQEEARIEALRKTLLRLLGLRYGRPIPRDVSGAVGELTEEEDLSRWLDAFATAASLAEFRDAVGLE
jgi:hypothetical protein